MNISLEEQLKDILAEQIQKEIDEQVIWDMTQAGKWPYSLAFLHYNAVKSWMEENYIEGTDYVYRNGQFYFAEEKIYTWFILRWSSHVPSYRRA